MTENSLERKEFVSAYIPSSREFWTGAQGRNPEAEFRKEPYLLTYFPSLAFLLLVYT